MITGWRWNSCPEESSRHLTIFIFFICSRFWSPTDSAVSSMIFLLKILCGEMRKSFYALLRHVLAVLLKRESVNKLASFSSLFPPTPSFPSLSLSPHPPTPRPPVATKAPLAAPQKPRKERRQPNIAQTSTARSKFRLRLRHLARQHAVATFVHTSPPLRHRGERHRRREAHTLLRSLCGRGGLAESVA
ncbi:hypothetical protein BLNAU_17917 [Blattamonas nauphoetae]|uniref:Uncharacterized protein n=1 Tax=Blattamonas nauphoetae TaxID=2049346 RepID=A0ABQ9XA42_9EUKA|nr:hypothetical protein BLNAU_17917 [Blattamonas nauphoetae]